MRRSSIIKGQSEESNRQLLEASICGPVGSWCVPLLFRLETQPLESSVGMCLLAGVSNSFSLPLLLLLSRCPKKAALTWLAKI